MSNIDKSYAILKTFKRVREALRRQFEDQYKDLQLTGPQGMLIHYLALKGALKVSDVSECMQLSNSTVSSIIDRLEQQGRVARTRSTEDKRVVMVDLTPEFKATTKQRFQAVENFILTVTEDASPQELDKILEGLSLLDHLLERKRGND